MTEGTLRRHSDCRHHGTAAGAGRGEGSLYDGCDDGYVFSDRRLGGADVLATSYTLSQAIRSAGNFNLILCGKQTTDGDTAQVGPAIAVGLLVMMKIVSLLTKKYGVKTIVSMNPIMVDGTGMCGGC